MGTKKVTLKQTFGAVLGKADSVHHMTAQVKMFNFFSV